MSANESPKLALAQFSPHMFSLTRPHSLRKIAEPTWQYGTSRLSFCSHGFCQDSMDPQIDACGAAAAHHGEQSTAAAGCDLSSGGVCHELVVELVAGHGMRPGTRAVYYEGNLQLGER